MADHFYNEIADSTHPDPIQLEAMSPGPTSFEPGAIEPISEPVRTPDVESRPIPDPATKIKKMKRCLIIMSVLLILLFCIAAAGVGLGLYSQLKPNDQVMNGNSTTVATDTKSSTQMQSQTQSSSTESTQKTTSQSLPSTVTDTTVYVNPTSHQPNSAISQEPSSPSTTTETITDEISSTSSSTTESTTYKDTTLKEPISTISTTEVNTTETTISQKPSPVTLTTEFTPDGILTSEQSSSLNATAEHSSSLNAAAENTIHIILTFIPPNASITTSTTSTPTTPSVHLAGCEDVKNLTLGEGVYNIYPRTIPDGVEVYCDAEGWTVFQRRLDGSEDFYRNWNDYVNGFGNKTREFWLGLETIHQLIKYDHYELRVDFEDFPGNTPYAVYSSFQVRPASLNYTLYLSDYSGTAGNAMIMNSGSQFSTKDVDNDSHGSGAVHCAQINKSGWWFSGCTKANPNGPYHDFLGTSIDGIVWNDWKTNEYLKTFQMKFRKTNL